MMLQVFLIEPMLGFAGLVASGAWRAAPPHGAKRWITVIVLGAVFAVAIGCLLVQGLATVAALLVFAPILLRVADWFAQLGAPRGYGMVMQWTAVASFVGPLLIGLIALAFYRAAPTDPPGSKSVSPPPWTIALAVAAFYVGLGLLARRLAITSATQLEREAREIGRHDGR